MRYVHNEFDKMQIPTGYGVDLFLLFGWFGDYRSLRFCAATSVVALFILRRTTMEKQNNFKNKLKELFNKWLSLSDFWKIASLASCFILIAIIIAIPISISSATTFTEEHQVAYDLVTYYYYDILDEHNLESAESFEVNKCEVFSHDYSDSSYFGGWFYIEINNTYKSYYFMQITSDGINDSLQQASKTLGQSWDFEPSISTRPLNKKLKSFIEEENKFGQNEGTIYELIMWNYFEIFEFDNFTVAGLKVLEGRAENNDTCWLKCEITLESGQTQERYYYIDENSVISAKESEYSSWTYDENLEIEILNKKLADGLSYYLD